MKTHVLSIDAWRDPEGWTWNAWYTLGYESVPRKVQNCPIEGTDLRLTAYATGYADTYFTVPACTRHKGKYIGGFFIQRDDGAIEFAPYDKFSSRLPLAGRAA